MLFKISKQHKFGRTKTTCVWCNIGSFFFNFTKSIKFKNHASFCNSLSSSARFLTNSLSDNSPLSNDASPGDFCSTGFSETEGGGGEECLPRFLLFLLLEFLAASESLALESTGDRLRLDFLDFLDFLLLYSTSLKSLKDSPESEYLDLPFFFRRLEELLPSSSFEETLELRRCFLLFFDRFLRFSWLQKKNGNILVLKKFGKMWILEYYLCIQDSVRSFMYSL